MNYEVNFKNGYETVEIAEYGEIKGVNLAGIEEFINNEAVTCELEFISGNPFQEDWDEYSEDEVRFNFYNADKTKAAYIAMSNDEEEDFFWTNAAKEGATIEGFSFQDGNGFTYGTLKVEKVKVSN